MLEPLYVPAGVRVQTVVTPGDGSPAETTEYLVDTSGALSQVVAETDGVGALVAYYVRGGELLSVIRGTKRRYYHADGLGSML